MDTVYKSDWALVIMFHVDCCCDLRLPLIASTPPLYLQIKPDVDLSFSLRQNWQFVLRFVLLFATIFATDMMHSRNVVEVRSTLQGVGSFFDGN